MRTDLLRPANKPRSISLQVCLVLRRHMAFYCTVLIGTAMEPQMGGNARPCKENLHGSPGQAHIHLLLDVFIRYGVVHALYADMIIVLDSGNLPDGQFKGMRRKRQQEELLF